jgi:SdpI/YfhL protein family
MIAILALYSFGGLILAGLSVPLVIHKIPPNSFFGIRSQATVNNPKLWYKINAYAGMRLLATGLGTAVGSIILFYLNSGVEDYALSCLGVFLALFLWAMISSFLYVRNFR